MPAEACVGDLVWPNRSFSFLFLLKINRRLRTEVDEHRHERAYRAQVKSLPMWARQLDQVFISSCPPVFFLFFLFPIENKEKEEEIRLLHRLLGSSSFSFLLWSRKKRRNQETQICGESFLASESLLATYFFKVKTNKHSPGHPWPRDHSCFFLFLFITNRKGGSKKQAVSNLGSWVPSSFLLHLVPNRRRKRRRRRQITEKKIYLGPGNTIHLGRK